MATITLSVPDEIKKEMDRVHRINWSSVAREAFIQEIENEKKFQKMKAINELKRIVKKSKLTEKDALEISKKIKKSMHEDLKKRGLA